MDPATQVSRGLTLSPSAAESSRLWKHESLASRALLPTSAQGAPGYTVGKVAAACLQELCTVMARDNTQTFALWVGG